ncbi:MAG: hypothetical protein ACYC0V_11200 [Armatimonadota bacterium]
MIEPEKPASNYTNALILWGYILAGLTIIACCCPCPSLYGLASLTLGIVAYSRGDQRGKWVIIAAIVALILTGALKFTGVTDHQIHRWVPPQYQGPWVNT